MYAGSIPTPASDISLARRNDARGPRESGAAPRLFGELVLQLDSLGWLYLKRLQIGAIHNFDAVCARRKLKS